MQIRYAILGLFFLVSCAAGGGQGGINLNPGAQIPGGSVPNTTNAPGGVNNPGGGSPNGGGNALPQASIPAPTLKKQFVLTYNPDENTDPNSNDVPVVGYNNPAECQPGDAPDACAAVDCPDNQSCVVVVSTDPIPTARRESVEPRLFFAKKSFRDYLLPIAHAQVANPILDLCDDAEHYGCCQVSADGSFECFAPQANLSSTTIYMTVFATTSWTSDDDTDEVNPNIFYIGEAPKSISAQGNRTFALTEDGTAVELLNGRVQRDRQTNYAAFLNDRSPSVAVNGSSVATMNPNPAQNGGISNRAVALVNGVPTVGRETLTVDTNAAEYTVLKRSTDGKLRFGVRPSNQQSAYIDNSIRAGNEHIDLRTGQDRTWPLNYQILAFDVNSNNCAVALYEGANANGQRNGGAFLVSSCKEQVGTNPPTYRNSYIPIISPPTFISSNSQPLSVPNIPGTDPSLRNTPTGLNPANFEIQNFADGANMGRALLLNKSQARLYDVQYNVAGANRTVTATALNNVSIPANANLVLNSTKTNAFLTSPASDELISIDLTQNTLVARRLSMSMMVPNKSVPLGINVIDTHTSTATAGEVVLGGSEMFGGLRISEAQINQALNATLVPRLPTTPILNPITPRVTFP